MNAIYKFVLGMIGKRSGVVTTLPNQKQIEFQANMLAEKFMQNGIDPNAFKSPEQVKNVLANIDQANMRVISPDSAEGASIARNLGIAKKADVMDMEGNKIPEGSKIMGGKEVPTSIDQESFLSRVNKAVQENRESDAAIKARLDADNKKGIAGIQKKIMEEDREIENLYGSAGFGNDQKIDAEFLAEYLAENAGKVYDDLPTKERINFYGRAYDALTRYKKNVGRSVIDEPQKGPGTPEFDGVNKDPEYAKGGRAGFYTGGITDVEPSLDDIGHGADALNARTRLLSPGAQATTSTGLNYLLADDNDNMRIPFAGGGDPRRRAFLKLLATLGGGIAGIKTGILGLGGKETGKQVAKEVVKSAGSGNPPPYFFKLVDKIKTMGDDIGATQDRTIAKSMKSKDGKSEYILEEDVSTGDTIIKKINKESDDMVTDVEIMQHSKGQADELTKGKKPADSYEEVTEYNSRIYKDNFNEPDYVDGIKVDEILEEVGETVTKKADGGRIGFSPGGLANVLARLGITGSSRRFLEKSFGKDVLEEITKKDPDMHRGLLEVVEMFRNRDKEGLKMYMQKFLPHMDDAEIEQFIVGTTPDVEGLKGQLIRLGSGRDYAQKLEMMNKAKQAKKLQEFDIKNVTKNAEGGRIGFSGGGIFRAIIAKAAAAKGMKPYEFIKVTSYKSLPREVKMFMSAEDFAQLKSGQKQMYSNYIDMAKTRKNFQQEVEGGKTTPAKPLFESMEKMMDEQSYVPKNVTTDDIAEMELMVKNRFNKGRKDNALGGLQTMLGE